MNDNYQENAFNMNNNTRAFSDIFQLIDQHIASSTLVKACP